MALLFKNLVKMNRRLAIIIVNWNQRALTSACIDSLKGELSKGDEIILVDNGSEESERPSKLKQSQLQILQSDSNLGFTGGNNLGLKLAIEQGFKWVMLLNNDTEVEKGCIEYLVKEVQRGDRVGAVQPVINWMHDKDAPWSLGGTYNRFTGLTATLRKGVPNDRVSRAWLTGCAVMIPVSVLKHVGLLDERYFAYFEDVDLSFRIREAGYQLFLAPSFKVYHHAGASGKSKIKTKEGFLTPILHRYNIRNHIYLVRTHAKWYSFPSIICVQTIKISLYISYFLLKGRFKKLRAVLIGIKEGVTG